jgi:hypothetical protein
MNITRSVIVAAGLVAATAAVGVWGFVTLPHGAFLAYHQGFGGPESGRLAKGPALALAPAISALVVTTMAFAARSGTIPAGLQRSARIYGLLMVLLAGVFLVTQVALTERMRAANFNVLRLVFLSVAVLLVMLGNDLGKIRQNQVFGVRTPWTLRDARVWDKTHRRAGRLMVVGGLALVPTSLLVSDARVLVPLMVLFTVAPLIDAIAYSRRAARKGGPSQA